MFLIRINDMFCTFLIRINDMFCAFVSHRHHQIGIPLSGMGALHAESLKHLSHLAGIACPAASLPNHLFQNLRIISFKLLGI